MVRGGRILGAVLVTGVVYGLALPAVADHVTVYDRCSGVDHPPFEREYRDPGASVALAGLTTSLPAGSQLQGVLYGPDGAVEAVAGVDDAGRAVLEFPIHAYGTYEWVAADDKHDVGSGALEVGADDQPCSRSQLQPAPSTTTEGTDEAPASQETPPAADADRRSAAETEEPVPVLEAAASPSVEAPGETGEELTTVQGDESGEQPAEISPSEDQSPVPGAQSRSQSRELALPPLADDATGRLDVPADSGLLAIQEASDAAQTVATTTGGTTPEPGTWLVFVTGAALVVVLQRPTAARHRSPLTAERLVNKNRN